MELGKTYRTVKNNKLVMMVEENDLDGSYRCMKGCDGKWRYTNNPPGRITGSAFDMSHPDNVIPYPVLLEYTCTADAIDMYSGEPIHIKRSYNAYSFIEANRGFIEYLHANKTICNPVNINVTPPGEPF